MELSVPRKVYLTVMSGHTLQGGAYLPDQNITMAEDFPPFYYGETVIFCITFFDSEDVPSFFGKNDAFELAGDNDFDHSSSLLLYAGPETVNVEGDWDEADPAAGKISIRVNSMTEALAEKLNGLDCLDVRLQVYRTITGKTVRSILMDVPAKIRNTVMMTEGVPVAASPGYYSSVEVDLLLAGHNTLGTAHADLFEQKAPVVHNHSANTILTAGGEELETVLDNMLSAAECAQSTADTALAVANDALSAVSDVHMVANNSQSRADEAYVLANMADGKAADAQAAAVNAQCTADNARNTADIAQADAETAMSYAASSATDADTLHLIGRTSQSSTPGTTYTRDGLYITSENEFYINAGLVRYVMEAGESSESGISGKTGRRWYRLWSDGWLEQGGEITGYVNNTVISLLLPYCHADYHAMISIIGTGAREQAPSLHSRTETSFKVAHKSQETSAEFGIAWFTAGWSA